MAACRASFELIHNVRNYRARIISMGSNGSCRKIMQLRWVEDVKRLEMRIKSVDHRKDGDEHRYDAQLDPREHDETICIFSDKKKMGVVQQ